MVGSQLTQDIGSALPMEQILWMFEELKDLIEGLTTQGANLSKQAKQDRALMQADQDNLAIPNKDFNEHVLAKKIELPSSQSNDEDFPLDEPTSKERTTLSI
ncbi:hypothetical protein ACLB2K_074552 [Fragaria x ananassa]